jgi:hypothetical protein
MNKDIDYKFIITLLFIGLLAFVSNKPYNEVETINTVETVETTTIDKLEAGLVARLTIPDCMPDAWETQDGYAVRCIWYIPRVEVIIDE